jgi:hypothetical protein
VVAAPGKSVDAAPAPTVLHKKITRFIAPRQRHNDDFTLIMIGNTAMLS